MNKLIFKVLLSVLMIVNMASLVISCGNSKNNLKETISTENISSDEYVNEEISADEGLLYNYKMNSDGTWSAAGHTYKDKLVLTGKLPNSSAITTYVVLSNDTSLTFEEVERQLTEAGLTEKLEELRKLNEAGSSEEEEPSKEPGEGSEGIVEEEKNESSDKKDDTIVVEGNKNPEANKGDKLPNTGAEISFAIVLAGALALVGAGLALINEKKKIS